MTHAQAKARHAELVEEVRKHDHLYYVQATPQLSDRELSDIGLDRSDIPRVAAGTYNG